MSVAVEAPVSRVPLPLPTHFCHAEQSFSLKKRRWTFSPSSPHNSSCASPVRLSHSVSRLPPSKGPLGRISSQPQTPWTPLSQSLSKSPPPSSVYDPSKQESYFSQCFTNLGMLGRGSFGEVFKVQSNKDGQQYAIKRSAQRFRSKSERNRSVKEARNHERLCPHPHILNFVAAWEECGRLYIQTELCNTSLLHYAENQPPGPDEPSAWAYLCDLLSALQHLHSHGTVHLDIKPANVLITDSGRLKLGDFGLLLELKQMSGEDVEEKVQDDVQEGDPRYMAPELLRGVYGPAADIFSLGVSILELACNIEVPNGGEGWQQLRRGSLPSEFMKGLSAELQSVLKMMLTPEPSERPTVSELLALPSVRKHMWKRTVYLMATEAVLKLASLCQLVVHFVCRVFSPLCLPFFSRWTNPLPCTPPKDSWDRDLTLSLTAMQTDLESPEDTGVFVCHSEPQSSPVFKGRLFSETTSTPLPGSPLHSYQSPAHRPTCSVLVDWSSFNLPQTPSGTHANSSCQTQTPNVSPIHGGLHASSFRSSTLNEWVQRQEAIQRTNLEPKRNLLILFEEMAQEGEP